MANVITLRGTPIVDEQVPASAAITSGDLIEVHVSTGLKLRRHATAAANAAAIFALNRDETGDEITVDYAASDRVKAAHYAPGMRVNAFIGSGQNLTGVEFLESAGDGTLRALVTDAATDDTQRASVVARSLISTGGAVAVKTRHPVVIV
jgi:hypothetical protein